MDQLNKPQTYKFQDSRFRRNLFKLLRSAVNLFAEIEIHHPERALTEGAVMYAANHISAYDGVIMQIYIPRILRFMSKAELFRNPLMRYVLNKVGSFPVKRGEFDRQAIMNVRAVLEGGMALLMFPEGTRTYGKGMVQAKTGTAHFALKNNCPIIPVAIYGAEQILKHGIKKSKVDLVFCQPIEPGKRETAGELTARIMQSIAEELPPHMRGVYA